MERMTSHAHRGRNIAAAHARKGATLADNTRAILAIAAWEAKAILAQLRRESRSRRDAREVRHYGRKLTDGERLKVVKDHKSIRKAIVAEDLVALEQHRLRLKRRERTIRG